MVGSWRRRARKSPPTLGVEIAQPDHPYVGRGGIKLAGALDTFAIDPAGRRALDIGASTGGFTDVLLQRGAASVVALDVGHGQLDWRLRNDPRVLVREGVNARALTGDDVPHAVELVTIDVAFISLQAHLSWRCRRSSRRALTSSRSSSRSSKPGARKSASMAS